MEQTKFKELANRWKAATDKVLDLDAPDRKDLSNLFVETYSIIKEYSHENKIPKELYRVLWEMNDFHWWVIETEETPIHYLHQEISTLVIDFNYFVVRGWTNELDIRYHIAKIEGEL